MRRTIGFAAALILALGLSGCKHLYPGYSFTQDTEREREWRRADSATHDFPTHMETAPRSTRDDWDSLFPK